MFLCFQMEQDRFIQHQKLYVTGIVCLLLSLILFFISIYILPFLIWNLHYHVPYAIDAMINFFSDGDHYSSAVSKLFTWLVFFIPAVVAGLISYFISNYIDNQILDIGHRASLEEESEEERISRLHNAVAARDTVLLSTKIIFLMVIIVIIILLLQVLISL